MKILFISPLDRLCRAACKCTVPVLGAVHVQINSRVSTRYKNTQPGPRLALKRVTIQGLNVVT